MASWQELKQFTWGDLKKAELTWGDLYELNEDELLKIVKQKLSKLKALPDDAPIPEDVNSEIEQIYQKAKRAMPDLKLNSQSQWSKKPTEILFTVICTEAVRRSFEELPSLIAAIISAIDRLTN